KTRSFRMVPSLISRWVRWFAPSVGRGVHQRPRPRPAVRRPSSPLSLDVLEDRWLLSTFLVTNTNNAGSGSLRQAILDANAQPGTDTIAFQIDGDGVHTIQPTSALPAITDPVVIDGSTQPGYAGTPLIELNGSKAGASSVSGLTIIAGSSTVQCLVINK